MTSNSKTPKTHPKVTGAKKKSPAAKAAAKRSVAKKKPTTVGGYPVGEAAAGIDWTKSNLGFVPAKQPGSKSKK